MRLIFFLLYWQYCSPPTQTAIYLDPSFILTCSGMPVQWLTVELWSRCLTCQDVFVNLVTKMEARNIAQRYAILCVCVCMLNSVTVPPQHKENFSRPWRWCNVKSTSLSLAQNVFWRQNHHWRWATQWTTINNTDKWQHSTSMRTCSIWSKIESQNDCWWSERQLGSCSSDTNWKLGMRKIWAKMVPRNLTEQQQDARLSVCAELLE